MKSDTLELRQVYSLRRFAELTYSEPSEANLKATERAIQASSGLKFLRIAEGAADLYPRLAPTCEWDTAAAQAVLEGAGGSVTQLDNAPPLVRQKRDLKSTLCRTRALMLGLEWAPVVGALIGLIVGLTAFGGGAHINLNYRRIT